MHLAAESHVDRSIDAPSVFVQTNVVGTFELLSAALDLLAGPGAPPGRKRFGSTTSQPTKCSGIFRSPAACSPRKRRTRLPRLIRHPRQRATTWCARGTTPMACRLSFPIARTITGPITFPRSSSRSSFSTRSRASRCRFMARARMCVIGCYVDDHARALETILLHGRVGESYNVGARSERTNLRSRRSHLRRPRSQKTRAHAAATATSSNSYPTARA